MGQPSVKFAPPLMMTFTVAIALVILLWLGTWKMQRLAWKEALITLYERNIDAAPTALADLERQVAGGTPLQDFEFSAVRLRGILDHDREMYLSGRSRAGEPGLHVLTPLTLENGDVVLLNRGWVPFEYRDRSSRADGLFAGVRDYTGILRLVRPETGIRKLVMPDNDPVRNQWYTLDTAAMAKWTGLWLRREVYFMDNREGLPHPLGRQWRLKLHNDHFEYALTWYGFGLILVTIYVLYGLRRGRELSAAQGDGDEG